MKEQSLILLKNEPWGHRWYSERKGGRRRKLKKRRQRRRMEHARQTSQDTNPTWASKHRPTSAPHSQKPTSSPPGAEVVWLARLIDKNHLLLPLLLSFSPFLLLVLLFIGIKCDRGFWRTEPWNVPSPPSFFSFFFSSHSSTFSTPLIPFVLGRPLTSGVHRDRSMNKLSASTSSARPENMEEEEKDEEEEVE